MSSLYSVWDICDDLILRKVNESDASVFAKRYGGSSDRKSTRLNSSHWE